MTLQVHLNKSGAGMAARTACGRNILSTPLSTDWEGFKMEAYRCIKCEESRQFALNTRTDLAKWIPEDPDAWKHADDALMAARR